MFRVVLSAYLLMLSLAGPSQCCCRQARIETMVWSLVNSDEATEFPVSECCRNSAASNPNENDEQSGPKLPTDCCKCVKNLCGGVPPEQLKVVVDQSRSLIDEARLGLASLIEPPPRINNSPKSATHFAESGPILQSGRALRVSLCSWLC